MKKKGIWCLLLVFLTTSTGYLFNSSTSVFAASNSQEILFRDNFEGDLSKWQILKEEVPDNIEITNSRGYLSSKSLLLDYQNSQSYLHLKGEFSSSSDVLVRVFFFDNLDESLGSIIEINDTAGSVGTGLGVVSAFYPNTYAIRINSLANTKDTGVARSIGWHMFEFIVTDSGTYAKIDNEKVTEFNASQTSVASVSLVSTWELTGQVFYDEIIVVKADSRNWRDQLYNPPQSFYLTYEDTDFSGLYPSLGLGMHSNDLRSVIDTGFAFYIYGKKAGDQTAITRGKQLLLDALTYGNWNQTNDWARGVYMASFTRAAYSMWDEFDNQTKTDIKKLIFDQAQTYLTRFPENGYTGDTKAEENAWHADFLAAIVNFFPSVPNRTALEEKAKCFAYHAITTSKDATYCGVKTQTVYDDFTLENHDLINPIYAAAAIHLLAKGGLSYTITGKNIPDEFKHNVENLYTNFLRPYTDLNTFYPQNLPTKLDWSGANNTLYYGTLAYAYLDHLGVPLGFSLNDHMQKRSLFFYNIASEWVQKPPVSINSWNQTNPNSDSYKWFLDNNNAGNVYANAITFLVLQPKPIIPNCSNLSGPSSILLGGSGTYCADYYSPEGNLAGEIMYDSFNRIEYRGLTGNNNSFCTTWTPASAGSYTLYCRAWNDGKAECQPPELRSGGPPLYDCQGPGYALQVEVLDPEPTITPTPTATPTPVPGDIDKDYDVDIDDYSILIEDFGKEGVRSADLNDDLIVDIFDYNILVGNFGASSR